APGDDYAMMREMLGRRFKRLILDAAEAPGAPGQEPTDSPGASSDTAHEGADDLEQALESETESRIEQPQPPPIDRRGGSALAFGVLRADAADAPALTEADVSELDTDADGDPPEPEPSGEDFPTRPDLVLIDGGRGQLGVAREVLAGLGIVDI